MPTLKNSFYAFDGEQIRQRRHERRSRKRTDIVLESEVHDGSKRTNYVSVGLIGLADWEEADGVLERHFPKRAVDLRERRRGSRTHLRAAFGTDDDRYRTGCRRTSPIRSLRAPSSQFFRLRDALCGNTSSASMKDFPWPAMFPSRSSSELRCQQEISRGAGLARVNQKRFRFRPSESYFAQRPATGRVVEKAEFRSRFRAGGLARKRPHCPQYPSFQRSAKASLV